jgi:hypothetical protein
MQDLLVPRDATETARQGQGIGDIEAMKQMATKAVPEALRNAPATSSAMAVVDAITAAKNRDATGAGLALAGLLPFGRILSKAPKVAALAKRTPLDEYDEILKARKYASGDYSDAAEAWLSSPEGARWQEMSNTAYDKAEQYLDQMAERGMRQPPQIEPFGQRQMVHGTTEENIRSLLTGGRLDPSQGKRVYGDLDWHRDVAYATSPEGAWISPEKAAAMRAAKYDRAVDVRLPETARMMNVRTPEEAGGLLNLLGLQSRKDFRLVGDSPYVPRGDADEMASRGYADKIRSQGIDVLNLTGRGAEALGTAPEQYVIFRPEMTRVLGERKIR